jgi:hypothetical protein
VGYVALGLRPAAVCRQCTRACWITYGEIAISSGSGRRGRADRGADDDEGGG